MMRSTAVHTGVRLALAALALGATSARAAEVTEVRVGTHEKSTRLVLELDQSTGYSLVTPQEGKPELTIHLNATSIARDVPSKSPFVRKVSVEPTATGSTVHVRLATANVDVKELLLANPPRLVFDLTSHGPIPKATPEEVAEAAESTSAPEPVAKIEEPPPAATDDAKPIVVAAADAAKPEMPPAPTEPMADPVEPAPEPIAQPVAPIAPPPIAVQETPPPPPPVAPQAAANAETRHQSSLVPKPQSTTPSGSESALAFASSPMGLGVIGAAVLLLGVILVMRRRRAGEDEDPLYTVMAADDAGAALEDESIEEPAQVRAAPIWEPDAYEASEPTPKQGPHQLTFGARPDLDAEVVPEAAVSYAPPDDSDSIFAGEPAPEPELAPLVEHTSVATVTPEPTPLAGAAMSDDTERRISELERRIDQLAEARERLERQVAAQTEELRVQRAAIARTQRVVRSIAKTEDMATEPVPRAPSIS